MEKTNSAVFVGLHQEAKRTHICTGSSRFTHIFNCTKILIFNGILAVMYVDYLY